MIGAGFCVQRVGPALGQPQALGGEASLGPEEAGVFIQQVTRDRRELETMVHTKVRNHGEGPY